ncbi:MAG: trypsin-like serine protease [Bradymonadales bacterium]|nr:trypsin-like serine protease [Bradymonadales bacterium]
MRIGFHVLLVGILVAALSGCGSERPDSLQYEQGQWPIVNGIPADASLYDAVVALVDATDLGYGAFCTGTLITPDVVVTAGHCLDIGNGTSILAGNLLIYIGQGPPPTYMNSTLHPVSEVLMHPGFNPNSLDHDIGLVRLAQPVSGVTPIPALPASEGFKQADVTARLPLDFVGFGADIECIKKRCYFVYDDVRLHLVGELTGLVDENGIYYPQLEGGPCFGDSGGPALVDRNNVLYLGGVTSYGDKYCLDYGVSTRVDVYETFINDFIGSGGCEDNTDCNDANECTSDACVNSACQFTALADETSCSGGICCGGECVALVCDDGVDCTDGEGCTTDSCYYPGTCDAYCGNEWLECGYSDGCCGPECSYPSDPDCEEPIICAGNKEACIVNADCCSNQCVNGKCRGN